VKVQKPDTGLVVQEPLTAPPQTNEINPGPRPNPLPPPTLTKTIHLIPVEHPTALVVVHPTHTIVVVIIQIVIIIQIAITAVRMQVEVLPHKMPQIQVTARAVAVRERGPVRLGDQRVEEEVEMITRQNKRPKFAG